MQEASFLSSLTSHLHFVLPALLRNYMLCLKNNHSFITALGISSVLNCNFYNTQAGSIEATIKNM